MRSRRTLLRNGGLVALLLVLASPVFAQRPTPSDVAGIAKALLSKCADGEVLVKDANAQGGVRCGTAGGALALPGDTRILVDVTGSVGGYAGFTFDGTTFSLPQVSSLGRLATTGAAADIPLWINPKNNDAGNALGDVIISATDPATWNTPLRNFRYQSRLIIASEQGNNPIWSAAASNSTLVSFLTSGGTVAVPSVAGLGDGTAVVNFVGYAFSDNSQYAAVGSLDLDLAASAPNGDHGWPGRFLFRTIGATGTNPVTRIAVEESGATFSVPINATTYKVGGASTITASGTSCAITAITSGLITAATCTP